LVNINAYHQPGVEAGKKAAGVVISLQMAVVDLLGKQKREMTAIEIASALGKPDDVEAVFAILRHLAANTDRGIEITENLNASEARFCLR
jgi:glucose-6-phosphate isomerase